MTQKVYAAWPVSQNQVTNCLFVVTEKPVWQGQASNYEQVKPLIDHAHAKSKQGLTVVGYVAYEAAPAFDPALSVQASNSPLPFSYWMAFEDKQIKKFEVQADEDIEFAQPWLDDFGSEWFDNCFHEVKNRIEQGDFYQLNLTTRLSNHFTHKKLAKLPWYLFKRLYLRQKATQSIFLDCGANQVLSLSPEVFFQWDAPRLVTSPMKGTANATVANWVLKDSAKDRAENIMIVDLLRNDMARVCKPRSVQVKSLFDVVELPTVKQMTSTITGLTHENTALSSVFSALFPCGSVTGAPKSQAMKAIAALEKQPRGIYCGSVGLIEPGGLVKMNVAIRTLSVEKNQLTYGVGSGITWYSRQLDERQEWWQKTEFLKQATHDFNLLETLGLKLGSWVRRQEHLARMHKAAKHFGFVWNRKVIDEQLDAIAKKHKAGHWRGRWLLKATGEINVQLEPLKPLPEQIILKLASHPIQKMLNWTEYKTTHRVHYDQFLPTDENVFDTLLFDEKHRLCETCRFNIVVLINDRLITPRICASSRSNLLNGVYRSVILRENRVQECDISISDLTQAKSVWLINSLREWVQVDEIFDVNDALIYSKA